MNRKQRIEMILRVLLCPFTELPSQQEDLLCAKAKAYVRMVTSKYDDIANKQAYEQACLRMERWLETQTNPVRLSEMTCLLEMFYPEEELRTYLSSTGYDDLDGYYIRVLLQLASEFVTLRDGRISIRMWDDSGKDRYFHGSSGLYKVELWSVLSRVITTDVLIAAYFVANGIRSKQQLSYAPENLSLSDMLLSGIFKRGVAETHLHLSAGMSYLTVWQVVTDPAAQRLFAFNEEPMLLSAQQKEQKEHSDLLIFGWLRLLMAQYLEDPSSDEKDICDYYMPDVKEQSLESPILRYVLEGPFNAQGSAQLWEHITGHGREYMAYLTNICPFPKSEGLDILLCGPYHHYAYLHTEPEIILLYSSLWHILDHPYHIQFIRVFLNYVRMKNSYFRDKFQTFNGDGLAFFSRYFQAAASAIWRSGFEDRIKEQLVYQSAFRNQLHCKDLRKLEVKISPQISMSRVKGLANTTQNIQDDKRAIARQLIQIFKAYKEVCEERPAKATIPCLGIIYHFIKSDVYHPSDNGCWATSSTYAGPSDEVSLLRAQCIRFLKALRALMEDVPYLDEYIVGLDAASQELRADPWVYAPVYRFARSRENTRPIHPKTGTQMQSIGLTYHVGEDYHHILTGMRHIDEVITHFGYKAGDRLGHAMALQVNLEDWVHDHETVPVPRLDRLEDLLWLWSLCERCPEELGKYRFEMESRTMKLAAELLKNIKGLTPYLLWQAYTMKFNGLDPLFCETMERAYLDFAEEVKRQRCELDIESQRPFCLFAKAKEHIWDAEKLLLTNYCPIYMRHYMKPMLVSTTPEDLPMLHAVQRYIRQKVQNMGIFVETNPTSNISIGDVNSLRDYPITRLNSLPLTEREPMSILLSINSDDPLVFNTNVENELALIYHTLIYNGYARENVLNWIDKVRQYGMDSSFIRTEKDRSRTLQELNEMIHHLEIIAKSYSTV